MRPNSGFFRGLIFFGNRNQASDLIIICTSLLRIFRKIQLNKQRFLTSVVFKKNEKNYDRGGWGRGLGVFAFLTSVLGKIEQKKIILHDKSFSPELQDFFTFFMFCGFLARLLMIEKSKIFQAVFCCFWPSSPRPCSGEQTQHIVKEQFLSLNYQHNYHSHNVMTEAQIIFNLPSLLSKFLLIICEMDQFFHYLSLSFF